MTIPSTGAHDPRLRALASFDILDTGPEKDFDDVAELAAAICEAPVALISFVAADRQVFKSAIGTDLRGTPLEQSICAHALLHDDLLEVPDTQADPRTRGNRLCQGEAAMRFYAGAQLTSSEGHRLGTLCVLDHRPRRLSDLQKHALKVLAEQVMKQLELRRALNQAEVLRREVDHRVKNSLQSVAALTRLQALASENPEVRAALQAAVQRVQTVAALHEQLYRTDAGGRIDLARYLEIVAGSMEGVRPAHVTLATDIAPVTLDSRQAAAVAVMLNEFAQNSFRHAFPEGRSGTVTILGRTAEEGQYRLTLMDDGIGFVPGDTRPGGLGLRVIEASAQQLDGTLLHDDADGGVRLELVFPVQA
ncbi:sensor histidine kinase [Oceaniglobus roseus]|uniref:sensor histidine kinase n=1 Tax=Oceaniglobus roseus TaxID=1737570 RepID=UPI000C7F3BC4|nr:histidine kinase dimerization/phosphoacceptor domain -containing protein [Kandeliimicrobium roseum]